MARTKPVFVDRVDPPIPKTKKKLTAAELAERPVPKKARKKTPSQVAKLREKRKKARMPKDQIKYLQEARAKKLAEKDAQKLVRVNLATFHLFGNARYGPGDCYVPKALVTAVLEQDRRAVEAESALFNQRSNMIMSANRGTVTYASQVANPNFDALWTGGNIIFDQVSGRGMDAGEGARF